jgi:hypothetical protein
LKRILTESTPLLDDEEIGGSAVIVVLSRFASIQRIMETHISVEPVLRFRLWLFGEGPENNQLITGCLALGSPWETTSVIEQTALNKLKEMDVGIECIKLTIYVVLWSPGSRITDFDSLWFHSPKANPHILRSCPNPLRAKI